MATPNPASRSVIADARSVFESASGKILSHPQLSSLDGRERVALSDRLSELENQFRYVYSARASPPSENTALFWLGMKLTGTAAEPVIRELLAGEQPEQSFQLSRPALISQEPQTVTPATRPRRTSSAAPSISQLRGQGYGNILDVRVDDETIYRFASNDPNLDLVGMGYSQLVEYAKNNPGSMRVFAVDERGRATREVRPSSL